MFNWCSWVGVTQSSSLSIMPLRWLPDVPAPLADEDELVCELHDNHTHTHPFNGPFLGLPRWASTKVKPIWILLKQETVSGSGISWAICKLQVCTLLQTDNHAKTSPLSFLQAGCPFCRLTNSVKALKALHDNQVTYITKCCIKLDNKLPSIDDWDETGHIICLLDLTQTRDLWPWLSVSSKLYTCKLKNSTSSQLENDDMLVCIASHTHTHTQTTTTTI